MQSSLVYILLLLTAPVFGSSGDSVRGIVETQQGTLEGDIQLNFEKSTLVLKNGNDYTLYSARQVKSVTVGDTHYAGTEYEGDFYLFEVLYQDDHTSILFRENLKEKYTEVTALSPYFIESEAGLTRIVKSKEVIQVFGDDEKWMNVRIKSLKIDLDSKEDLKDLFAYYQENRI